MSMGWATYKIVDASKENLTIDTQMRPIIDGVPTRNPTIEERHGEGAIIYSNDLYFENYKDYPKGSSQKDYDWWCQLSRVVTHGRYLIVDHQGIDTIIWKSIVLKLTDDDDWGKGILKHCLRGDDYETYEKLPQLVKKLDVDEESYIQNLLEPTSAFQTYDWKGKVLVIPSVRSWFIFWAFTDERDLNHWSQFMDEVKD